MAETELAPPRLRAWHPAAVLEELDEGRVLVRPDGAAPCVARIATWPAPVLTAGDRVLLAPGPYVVGLVDLADRRRALTIADGTSAVVQDDVLAVTDPRGRVLFRYDAATGTAELGAPDGDLRLRAAGRIDLEAGSGVGVSGDRVDLDAGPAHLGLGDDGADLDAPSVTVRADSASADLGAAEISGDRCTATWSEGRLRFGRLEVTARRLRETFGDAFRSVESLCETRAGRLRTLIQGGWRLRAGQADLAAREDVRIDGDKINIG